MGCGGLIRVDPAGGPPVWWQGRWGHSMTLVSDSKIIVYGGEGDDPATGAAKTFGDTFVYCRETRE
jgi:hypothetical protein